MFVQKKYPKVAYTMHIELTQEEVERITHDMSVVGSLLLQHYFHPGGAFRDLYALAHAIRQEAGLPFGC